MALPEDLWYGNVNPHEAILTENRRYKHLLSLMGRNRDELSEFAVLRKKDAERCAVRLTKPKCRAIIQ